MTTMRTPHSVTSNTDIHDCVEPSRMKPWNVLIGIAISLLLHGSVALWAWNLKPIATQAAHISSRPIEVRLLPEIAQISAPIAPPTATHAAPTPAPITQRAPASRRTLQIVKSEAVAIIVPVTPAPANPTATEKHIDLDAIHANLGSIVAEVDREKNDTPVGQFQTRPLYPADDHSKLGKAIEQTARPDCKDSIANTYLLAPFILLKMVADKKDSGCKW
jgi:hypothetical protein